MEKPQFSFELGWVFGFYQKTPVKTHILVGFLNAPQFFTENE